MSMAKDCFCILEHMVNVERSSGRGNCARLENGKDLDFMARKQSPRPHQLDYAEGRFFSIKNRRGRETPAAPAHKLRDLRQAA